MKIRLFCVGKLKDSALENLEKEYLKRLPIGMLEIRELKARAEDVEAEGKDILKETADHQLIILTENGKQRDSIAFANWLAEITANSKPVALAIGGAAGFSTEVRQAASASCSLSLMTFPHKFARLILIEQLYRAHTIIKNHPYHK